jgi:hypothetical protein
MGNETGINRRYAIDVDRPVEMKHITRGHHEYTFHRYIGVGEPWRDAQGRPLPPGEPFKDADGNPLTQETT